MDIPELNFVDENATLLSQLDKLANEDPDKPAYIFVDKDLKQRVITRQEVWDKTRRCAAIFKRLGLRKEDVVCNTLANSPERLITYFGTVGTGATSSHGQLFLADGSDLIHHLKESKSTAFIYDSNVSNGAGRILDAIKFRDEKTGVIGYKDLPDLKHAIDIKSKGVEEAKRWINRIDEEKEMFVDENITKSDIAMVFVTSGTTGFSKLVPHTHTHILFSRSKYIALGGQHDDLLFFNMQSLGWIGGFPAFYATTGCTRILIDLTNDLPEDMATGVFLVNIFNQNCPNKAFMVTRDIQHVLDAYRDDYKLNKQFDVLYTAGGPVRNPTKEALGKITKKILVCYGATEFLLGSTASITEKSDFIGMCAGHPVKGLRVEIKIVDDDEKEVSLGEQGELFVRSGTLFKGYLNNPIKTVDAFTQDGWYRTGDIGYFNKEGLLFVLCRKADAINKDGYIHYPGWMEQRINKHSGIESSIVIGISDPVHHEEICLCYKSVTGSDVTVDDVQEHCKKLFLLDKNDKMTPIPEHYLVFDDFIVNANGKIDRKKMREEVMKRLLNINQ